MPMHDMQNYNQSILSLFDPLRTPATPERDAASPDLSDKENDGPSDTAGQVTVFFNRVYKHPSHQTVKTPRGKLIDYDLTAVVLPDREEDDMDEDEEEGGMVLDGLEADAENGEYRRTVADDDMDENADEDTIQIPVSRRQPLADIQLDSVLGSIPEPDPIPVEGSPDSSMWDAADTTIQAVSAAPAGAPLASIINAINFASLSLHSPDSSHEPSTPDGQSGFDCPAAPEINVVEADSSHGSPTAPTPRRLFGSHLSPSPSSSSFATRRLSPTTSATDPRRTSVDLQSSFHLQLQNAEMTFDLMNDKISFLGHDSFWVGNDEDSVDLKKEEQAMMAIAEEYEPQYSANGQTAPSSALSSVFTTESQPSVERRQSLPLEPASDTGGLEPFHADSSAEPPEVKTLSPRIAVQATPASVSAAPVPALRIVKKSWKIHGRPSSVSSTSSSSSSSVPSDAGSRVENVPAKRSAPHPREEQRTGVPPVPEMQKARAVVKGIQRPPPGAQLPPVASMGPAKMRAVSADVSGAKRASVSTRPGILGRGPPTVPTQRPTQVLSSKFPTSTFGMASRLPGLGKAAKTTSGIPTSSSGSLRPPRSSNAPVRSGLPIPQSRIPSAPTVLQNDTSSRLPTGAALARRLF